MARLSNSICLALLLGALLPWSPGAQAEHYTIPLLVPPDAARMAQGILRIANATGESGPVEIFAIDDAGTRSGPATFTLGPLAAVELSARDLQSGNAAKGLSGGIGGDSGEVRLLIDTELEIVPMAYFHAADGTLSVMHQTVRAAPQEPGQYRYEVPIFNPSTDATQESRLRLINPGDAVAAVTISGRDDAGAPGSGGDVTLTVAAGGATTLTARQLEAGGSGIAGRIGAGTGRWRLTAVSDQPLQVVNLVAASAGYWNNLSTTAAAGMAPADQPALGERFVGRSVVYETDSGRFTLNAMDGGRFTESVEPDGFTTVRTGVYSYAALGPDAGRLTLDYDDGATCRANFYFSSRTSGWLAAYCAGAAAPDGYRLSGDWFIERADDGDDGAGVTAYAVGETLPGVPVSGPFVPRALSGGSIEAAADAITITLDEGGYFELDNGTRFTCTSVRGCAIRNGAVTAGAVAGHAPGTGPLDRFPSFREAVGPGDRLYTVGAPIDTLTLPLGSGGNGALSYSLSPAVPGLSFDAATRQLSGTPAAEGSHAMTYTVTDEDGDTDALGFTITVRAGYLGDCRVGLTVGIGQSCAYPGTADEFSVNERGRGRFLDRLAGIRIHFDSETVNGRVYDLEASHQGDGVWRIGRLAGSTMPAGENLAPSFAEGSGPGIQTFTAGLAIAPLTLPAADGGDGALTYSLAPDVPGLMFDGTTRRLGGTPTTVGTYDMTYTAADGDGDTAALNFRIVVGTVSGTITRCFGVPAPTGVPNYRITIEGYVLAHTAISNVTVTGYGNGAHVGSASLGAIAAGDAGDFSINGVISTGLPTLGCTVDIEYAIAGG